MHFWLAPIIGPIIGAILGALLYVILIENHHSPEESKEGEDVGRSDQSNYVRVNPGEIVLRRMLKLL